MVLTASPLGANSYSADTFSLPFYALGNFVIADYLNDLAATAPAVGIIRVNTGAAALHGRIYENGTTVDLAIDAAVNNRIDRIILRIDANSVDLTVVKGAEAANPNPPAIDAGNDLALWWIWVPAGFNPAVNTIAAGDIHDERSFRQTGPTVNSLENLMFNSEFLAYSSWNAGNIAPEGWRLVGVPVINGVAPLNTQLRGRGIRIQAGLNVGMRSVIRLPAGYYTVKGVVNVTTGNAAITVSTFGTFGFRRTGVDQEFIIRGTFAGGDFDIYAVGGVAGSDFTLGQILIVQGYIPGHFRPKHEFILLDTALADAAWAATAKSTGETLISLNASFGNMLSSTQPVRGVLLRLIGNDSGSAATPSLGLSVKAMAAAAGDSYISRLDLGGVVNDTIRTTVGLSPMVNWLSNQFYIVVAASGVGTLDATVYIIGIIT